MAHRTMRNHFYRANPIISALSPNLENINHNQVYEKRDVTLQSAMGWCRRWISTRAWMMKNEPSCWLEAVLMRAGPAGEDEYPAYIIIKRPLAYSLPAASTPSGRPQQSLAGLFLPDHWQKLSTYRLIRFTGVLLIL